MTKPSWFYDEMVHKGTDYNDISEVENYEKRMSQFRDFEKEADEVFHAVDLKEKDTILEMGCGTGWLSLMAAPHCREVFAVDISKPMIDYGKSRAVDMGLKNISFIHSGFLNYNHQGPELDAVISQIALHHLPDFWKLYALKNINGMLKEGGKLFIRDVVFNINLEKFEKTMEFNIRDMKEKAGEETAENFISHISSEFSTYDWIMEEILYRAGFNLERAEYDDGYMALYLCSKRGDQEE